MSTDFEELDFRKTPLGELTLRRRRVAALDGLEVFEVKLGEDFLMSSMFHEVEVALADLSLAALGVGEWDVVVGGLGLGYTAAAALGHATVRSLLVVETLDAVIEWHRSGLVPLGAKLTADPRCRVVHGDFFALAADAMSFDPEQPGRRFHAILLDIDHSPRNLLHPRHGAFYTPEGLLALSSHLHAGGVFALWSDDPPDDDFLAALDEVFDKPKAHVVKFANPLLDRESASTVYIARQRASPRTQPSKRGAARSTRRRPAQPPAHPLDGVTVIDHPLVQVKLTQLRDVQTGSREFRARLNELSTLMVFEATRDLATRPVPIQTPLAPFEGRELARPVVVAPILRAGLGLVEGMLQLLPHVSVAHIGMFRNEQTHLPESYYFKAPAHLADADVILVDPMLATGGSATGAVTQLKEAGAKSVRFVCIVSCAEGLAQLRGAHPDVRIFTAAIDPVLNDRAYIVPGLGDAGDRYFGTV